MNKLFTYIAYSYDLYSTSSQESESEAASTAELDATEKSESEAVTPVLVDATEKSERKAVRPVPVDASEEVLEVASPVLGMHPK
jgi:hypothetical protein